MCIYIYIYIVYVCVSRFYGLYVYSLGSFVSNSHRCVCLNDVLVAGAVPWSGANYRAPGIDTSESIVDFRWHVPMDVQWVLSDGVLLLSGIFKRTVLSSGFILKLSNGYSVAFSNGLSCL